VDASVGIAMLLIRSLTAIRRFQSRSYTQINGNKALDLILRYTVCIAGAKDIQLRKGFKNEDALVSMQKLIFSDGSNFLNHIIHVLKLKRFV